MPTSTPPLSAHAATAALSLLLGLILILPV